MSKVNFWVAAYNSCDILIVIVKVRIIISSLLHFPSTFVFTLFHGPFINFGQLIEAYYYVQDDVFVIETFLAAFYDGIVYL